MSAKFLPDSISAPAATLRAEAKHGENRFSASRWLRLIGRLYRFYFSTWSIRVLLPDGTFVSPADYLYRADIFAHCERESLVLPCILDFSPFTLLVAPGRDGDRAAAALESIGGRVVRGSSRCDGFSGLVKLTHALLSGPEPVAICVDGPLGPRGRVKQGVLCCSQVSGRPVFAVATAARWQVVFPRTWSQIFVPLPFSRVVISLGEGLQVPPHATPADRKELSKQLEIQLEWQRMRAEAAVRRLQHVVVP